MWGFFSVSVVHCWQSGTQRRRFIVIYDVPHLLKTFLRRCGKKGDISRVFQTLYSLGGL